MEKGITRCVPGWPQKRTLWKYKFCLIFHIPSGLFARDFSERRDEAIQSFLVVWLFADQKFHSFHIFKPDFLKRFQYFENPDLANLRTWRLIVWTRASTIRPKSFYFKVTRSLFSCSFLLFIDIIIFAAWNEKWVSDILYSPGTFQVGLISVLNSSSWKSVSNREKQNRS